MAIDRDSSEPSITSVGRINLSIGTNGWAVHRALQYFRGTFIDGTLQPNVRLGNGLQLLDEWPILETRESEQPDIQETQAEQTDIQETHAEAITEKVGEVRSQKPRDDLEFQKALEDLEMRESLLLAKSWELKAQERALMRRSKLFRWEQNKAKMAVNPYRPRQSARRQSPEPKSQSGNSGDSSSHMSDTAFEATNSGDTFPSNEFSIDNPAPPPALSALRARLRQFGRRR
jgi:hypothetical protein